MSFQIDDKTGTLTINSRLISWGLDAETRDYVVETLPFELANKYLCSIPFNDHSGQGEQRVAFASQVKKLKKEILGGRYTPTTFSANTTKKHEDKIKSDGPNLILSIPSEYPLHQTDGNQRFEALRAIIDEAEELEDDGLVDNVNQLPITIMIYTGKTDLQQDFINLQSGKTVDSNMVNVLKIRKKQLSAKILPLMEAALETARILNESEKSPWETQIRFDTTSVAELKFSSLASKGAADGASSIVGLCRLLLVGLSHDSPFCFGNTPELASNIIINCTNRLVSENLKACEAGFLLTPMPEGTVGSSTLLIGVATITAYLALSSDKKEIDEDDFKLVIEAIKATLSEPVLGDLSASRKRTLMKSFTVKLFENLGQPSREGVPVGLLEVLGPSAFGMAKE